MSGVAGGCGWLTLEGGREDVKEGDLQPEDWVYAVLCHVSRVDRIHLAFCLSEVLMESRRIEMTRFCSSR